MTNHPEERMRDILRRREEQGELRRMTDIRGRIDLSSNDYLGLSRSAWIADRVRRDLAHRPPHGATGSRLLTGTYPSILALERKIAAFHEAEAALIFNSGYAANEGLLQTVCREGDVILFDALVHASIRQGVRLSPATACPFDHGDMDHLGSLLRTQRPQDGGQVFVVVESVYSMDGDHASLDTLAALRSHYGFRLIVDEAHAFGVFGERGRGRCQATGIQADCFARVYTFGKALGHHGAVVVGSRTLIDYLINFCKPFIYSTAPDPGFTATVEHSYEFLLKFDYQRIKLIDLINSFKNMQNDFDEVSVIGDGPVFSLICGSPQAARDLSDRLNRKGFDVRPIVYPTVPRGSERIRLSLHSYNSLAELRQLRECLNTVKACV